MNSLLSFFVDKVQFIVERYDLRKRMTPFVLLHVQSLTADDGIRVAEANIVICAQDAMVGGYRQASIVMTQQMYTNPPQSSHLC